MTWWILNINPTSRRIVNDSRVEYADTATATYEAKDTDTFRAIATYMA